jgi:hypothetical protein
MLPIYSFYVEGSSSINQRTDQITRILKDKLHELKFGDRCGQMIYPQHLVDLYGKFSGS